MSTNYGSSNPAEQPFIARTIRRFSIPIILAWVALVVVLSVFVPSLEKVGEERAVSMAPKDAPSLVAMKRIGQVFQESNSDSLAMIVLEGDQPLGENAHKYYDELIRKLKADTKHVQHVQDFWGDPLTAAGAQSPDDKAAYVQINLAGNQGEPLANESVLAIRKIVEQTPPPAGIHALVTGPSPLITDMHNTGNKSLLRITIASVAVIFIMLLLVYRSPITVILLLCTVGIEFAAARGIVAFLGHAGLIRLSTFSVNLLTALTIAAGTDYGIFLIGRYREARQAGEDRETAYYTTFRGVTHVIVGSAMTIAGAMYCLSFARLPYFQTAGIPNAVGMLVVLAVAITVGPAILTVGGRLGVFDPKRTIKTRGWRRVGTVVVRWPAPILAAASALTLVALLALRGYTASYDDRAYMPAASPANVGYAASDRHFSQARLKPDVLMIESDHDMRNPADFLVLDKVAKAIFHVPGVSRVQAITRPQGSPIEHTSIPFQISMQNATQIENMKYQQNTMDNMQQQADDMAKSIEILKHEYYLMTQVADNTHRTMLDTSGMKDATDQLRDHLADFEDFWRPIRSYFYWDKHCFDIPICWSLRSIFDALDGVDQIAENVTALLGDLKNLDQLMPQVAATLPRMIATMEDMRKMTLTVHSTMSGIYNKMAEQSDNVTAMGKAFDTAKNDDSFYLPPEVFDNPNFMRVMKLFLSPDGKAARFIISHKGNPASLEGIASVDPIKTAAEEALKGTPLEDARIYLTGTAVVDKDLFDGSSYDLVIAGISSLCLIFIIMLIITRALVAALVIVGTVALSLGASFGLSVLVWQHIFNFQLHWLVLAMSVIVLLAVGSDYNLLLVSRFKQEMSAGLNTAIIRAMGGTGKVVTSAGLVFAATMASMIVSDLRIIGQLGTTIALGLLVDTLIVRSFMTPSIAALLGRWFWWPLRVNSRPATRFRARPASSVPVACCCCRHNHAHPCLEG
ncbi:MMPL/RND family transporter [Mycobacterium haemophilum]|uniref:Membrane protein n=1 Tax=Mycobacterium haemophilum TaxID=29311 RepID=A0A0I9U2E3_9MYCO|nr:RND family transporter [Mycobacterium haemophilum]KLO27780.1 membrane protein [Mycobacterium haemophilum]KLO35288.1 membrane protein [Mycobacterium haemophilum]KLO40299.1 membrane protein [Mycobacterium haemophilum]KLO47573.1 membrane protein [Mycobacterium haemophilum]